MECEFCRSFPHLPGCPNEPEPKAVYTCKYCGDSIIEGDEYAEINGDHYHAECLDSEMSIYALLDLFGITVETAQSS